MCCVYVVNEGLWMILISSIILYDGLWDYGLSETVTYLGNLKREA